MKNKNTTKTVKTNFRKELIALCNKYNIRGKFEGTHYFVRDGIYDNEHFDFFYVDVDTHPGPRQALINKFLETGKIDPLFCVYYKNHTKKD